ncbi:MAG: site-specific integrase [Pseudomonadota bacterium]|nr:site-specific integrase [Pseudomonadota bacterium]QKK05624.1 MAG: site-specific integrase [Pseudomonadota bacterium]
MARTVKDKRLDTRTARQSLKAQREPHWKNIDRGFHIGYRKHKDGGGSWIARVRSEEGKYQFCQLGKADDIQDADGMAVLDFSQAQAKGRQWFEESKKSELGIGNAKLTVNDILDDYLEYLRMHGKSAERAKYSIEAYLRPEFGHLLVTKLTSKKISDWHRGLAQEKPRQRSKHGEISNNEDAKKQSDYARKRKSSANRILTILKAALNRAYQEGKVASDDAWRRVKPFRNVENAKIRFLMPNEVQRLVNACDPDFRKMVLAGYFTACRYGELTKLHVSDFNPENGTLFIADSKNGKPRHVTLTDEGRRFFEKAVVGKCGGELIFTREDGEQWGRSHQTRRLKEACERARISPAISFHILRHTHASLLAQNGTPLPVIAHQLGHADTRICEKHYAHLTPNYVADTIRANFPVMGVLEDENIVSIVNVKKR